MIIMKKLFVLFVFGIFILGSAPVAFAQSSATDVTAGNALVGNAGTLPDSPFYGLKRFGENIQLFFAFDNLEKAKLKFNFAQTRLAEADAMASLNRTQLAENALAEYENGLNETENDQKTIFAAGRNVSALVGLVENNTYKHILVLQQIYEKVPAQAKSAVQNAIERSLEKQGKISGVQANVSLVNITIFINNHTITRQVPARFADMFLQKASEMEGRINRSVGIENETDLKNEIAQKVGINMERAQEQINAASQQINETAQKIAELNVTFAAANRLLGNAEDRLNKSETAFGAGKYGEAFGQAISAEAIAKTAEKLAEQKAETIKEAVSKAASRICAQVITPAVKNGECREFPTSCVPEGWERVDSCPSNTTAASAVSNTSNMTPSSAVSNY